MTSIPTTPAGEHDPAATLKRFVALNDARLARTREGLRPRHRDFLDLLPLLFHIHHPVLPGYLHKECPTGVHGYQPDKVALEAAARLGRSFQYDRQVHRSFQIQAIYLMGSPGSVAYSADSDFDIWICHDPAMGPEQVRLLREKATAIEKWADSVGLEVHFFLVRHDQFQRGETEALSSESSGSAQQRLLLDEFYRTGLRVAGMYPLWWLVPPEYEAAYDVYVEELKRQRFLHPRDLIDFGSLAHVPAEEFLGAAVWQLYKGIDSPYKSVLKLLLIESYAREYPYLDLLSTRFKRAVYAGATDVDRVDPYLMMVDKVEEYLKGRDERERLELARRCFYLKVGERLSSDDPWLAKWRHQLLAARTHEWGWGRAELYVLDSRNTWKVDRVSDERRVLFEALSESYRFLSGFARRYASSALISQRDLTILGRKLYSAFERKAGKVELLNRGFGAQLVEPQLSLHEVSEEGRANGWVLYRGAIKPDEAWQQTPVKRFRFVTELVAWCYFNGVLDKSTHVMVYARESRITAHEIRAMVARMHAVFPERATHHGKVEDYAEPSQMVQTALFVNAGVDPLGQGELTESRVASGRSDALSYGGLAENLVLTVDQVVVTSWQEVLTFHHAGTKGLLECLCEFLKWSPPSSERRPVLPSVASYSANKGNAVARRLEDLFRDVVECYYDRRRPPATRYVLQVERGYVVLTFDGDTPRYHMLESQAALLRYLGTTQKEFSPVVMDRYAHTDKLLPLIFEVNRPGVVQFFYRSLAGGQADIYVLDERGSLFYRRVPYHDADALLSQYSHFFEAVLNRVNFLMQEGRNVRGAEGLEFYSVETDGARLRLQRQPPRFQGRGTQYLSLQVIVEADDEGKPSFAFFCNGREFASAERGARALNEVVRYVLDLRRGGQAYPIYITDISMSPVVLGEDGADRVQTVHFLSYKHRIEERLNQAMAG